MIAYKKSRVFLCLIDKCTFCPFVIPLYKVYNDFLYYDFIHTHFQKYHSNIPFIYPTATKSFIFYYKPRVITISKINKHPIFLKI